MYMCASFLLLFFFIFQNLIANAMGLTQKICGKTSGGLLVLWQAEAPLYSRKPSGEGSDDCLKA